MSNIYLRYIASYPDLIAAFGLDAAAGQRHYDSWGGAEGRSLTLFDPLRYAASNPDLVRAFGANEDALARHYIEWGFREGRSTASFDALRYAASNPDLARAYGTDQGPITRHYIEWGLSEGRSTSSFDALLYAASNLDLARAFGTNEGLITRHYIEWGLSEGRPINSFDAVGYLLSNADLGAAGLGAAGALRHWLTYGMYENRAANSFDSDQAAHAVSTGRLWSGTFDSPSDKDWFSFRLGANQSVALNLFDPAGTDWLSGTRIEVYDSAGQLVAGRDVTGATFDNWLSVQSQTGGTHYVVTSQTGQAVASGNYKLAIAQVGPTTPPSPGYPTIFVGGVLTDVFLGKSPDFESINGGGGDDILGGGSGDDQINGEAGADFMDGGVGRNAVLYTNSPTGVEIDLEAGTGKGGWAGGDRLYNFEQVYGSTFDDVIQGRESWDNDYLHGDRGDDRIEGRGGQDVLFGGEGNDSLFGGDGYDYLYGGEGADQLDGGEGFDYAHFQDSNAGVRIDLRSGMISGGSAEGDTIESIEGIYGSYYADVIASNVGTNILFAGAGDDILIERNSTAGGLVGGGSGDDLMIGPRIRGDEGNDTLVAIREGTINYLQGEAGADTYVVDTLLQEVGTPFDISILMESFDSSDRIDLSDLRDESGHILDFFDVIQRIVAPGVIDLTGFRTMAGDSVVGYLELRERPDMFTLATPYDHTKLTAANFVFANGIDWQAMIPADFPLI